MTVKQTEHIISTPSGMRVLTEIQPGSGFAVIRPCFEPEDINKSRQRLQVQNYFDRVHVSEDGTFINPKHLWSILVQWAKPDSPLKLDDAAAFLLYPQHRSDLHPKLMNMFRSFDQADVYCLNMFKHGFYDPNSRTVHRTPRATQ